MASRTFRHIGFLLEFEYEFQYFALTVSGLPGIPQDSTMTTDSQRPKDRGGTLTALNGAIEGLNLAKEVSVIAPAKAAFSSVSVILTTIKVFFLALCAGTSQPVDSQLGFHD